MALNVHVCAMCVTQVRFMAEHAAHMWDKLVSKEQKKTLEWQILGYLSRIVRIATQKSFSHLMSRSWTSAFFFTTASG